MQKKKLGYILIFIILLFAILCLIGYMVWVQKQYRQAAQRYEDLASSAVQTPGLTPSPAASVAPSPTLSPAPEAWYAPYAQTPDKIIDFDVLQQQNPSIFAWITVPDTKIDYPIVMAERGEDTYLHYDAYGKKNFAGAIFAESWNHKDFSDRLTLLYGHNMRDGSMFHGVHAFRDARYFDAHDTIYIYWGPYRFTYKIVACYETTDEHLLAERDFTDDAVWQDYLQSIRSQRDLNVHLRDVDALTQDDRILTLSTCISGRENKRLFLQAVLVKNENNQAG